MVYFLINYFFNKTVTTTVFVNKPLSYYNEYNNMQQLHNCPYEALSEGGALLKRTSLREAGHRGATIMYSI